MKKHELLISVLAALVLSLGIFAMTGGFAASRVPLPDEHTNVTVEVYPTPPKATAASGPGLAINPAIEPSTTPSCAASTPTALEETRLPTLMPAVSTGDHEDDVDALLLQTNGDATDFECLFLQVCEYWGARVRILDLSVRHVTPQDLQDGHAEPIPLVAIDAARTKGGNEFLDAGDMALLLEAAESEGTMILLAGVSEASSKEAVSALTRGAIEGAKHPADSLRDWHVTDQASDIMRELSGQCFGCDSGPQNDSALLAAPSSSVIPLITATDDAGDSYCLFAEVSLGKGAILVDASAPADAGASMAKQVYHEDSFSTVVPVLSAVRYALGDEAWHNDHNYANLTIDDPTLTDPYELLNYHDLLAHMQASGFHTTIALIPGRWEQSDPDVVDLFREYPEYYSLAVHGNNHDGYEFYRYTVSEGDEYEGRILRARPLAEQQDDIIQALARMDAHQERFGIPYDRVMVFPWGICPEDTLIVLKEHNFLATVNGQDVPLDAASPTRYDYNLKPAALDYGCFPLIQRRHPGTMQPFEPKTSTFVVDLFLDKPALFYSHAVSGQLFDDGIGAFDVVAEAMNAVTGGVSWQSHGEIARGLFLEKRDDDGTWDLQMFTSEAFLENESDEERVYHVYKEETPDEPIASLAVNGVAFPYRIEGEWLRFDVRVPAGGVMDASIVYCEHE